jgi:peptide/nickel transport system ATP-binding protein
MNELLNISGLSVEYRSGGTIAKAVNNLNLKIDEGEALGLVGESGAGKTTTALSIMNLLPEKIGFITSGNINYRGKSMLDMSEAQLLGIRGRKISMVFANPLTSLNPVFTVGHQVSMVFRRHLQISKRQAREMAANQFKAVGISEYRMNDYPHQFSGGMRQRVGIAAALACSPEMLIADEPTTALDVTIQAQILELMKKLQKNNNTALLMITHNLGIIAELCQKVAIMYAGEIVEYGTVEEVFLNPRHPYTTGLLNAIPKLTGNRERLASISGLVANSESLPEGCKFHPRCSLCTEECKNVNPPAAAVNGNHFVSCCNWDKNHG